MVTLDYKTNIEHDIRKARNEKMNGYREYAFYVPELDAIIIQIFYGETPVGFEWTVEKEFRGSFNEIWHYYMIDPEFLLMPLGEV